MQIKDEMRVVTEKDTYRNPSHPIKMMWQTMQEDGNEIDLEFDNYETFFNIILNKVDYRPGLIIKRRHKDMIWCKENIEFVTATEVRKSKNRFDKIYGLPTFKDRG